MKNNSKILMKLIKYYQIVLLRNSMICYILRMILKEIVKHRIIPLDLGKILVKIRVNKKF